MLDSVWSPESDDAPELGDAEPEAEPEAELDAEGDAVALRVGDGSEPSSPEHPAARKLTAPSTASAVIGRSGKRMEAEPSCGD